MESGSIDSNHCPRLECALYKGFAYKKNLAEYMWKYGVGDDVKYSIQSWTQEEETRFLHAVNSENVSLNSITAAVGPTKTRKQVDNQWDKYKECNAYDEDLPGSRAKKINKYQEFMRSHNEKTGNDCELYAICIETFMILHLEDQQARSWNPRHLEQFPQEGNQIFRWNPWSPSH